MPEQLESVRRARAMFNALAEERDQKRAERLSRLESGEPEPACGDAPVVERVRLTRTPHGKAAIDLSKADPDCVRCGGTGRRPDKEIEDKETGEVMRLPVVCACVKRGGGVAKDLLDRLMDTAAKKQRWADRRKARRRARKKARRKARR